MPIETLEEPVVIVGLAFDQLLDEDGLVFDLREGTIFNSAKTRIMVLSTDLLSGICKALQDEAGPAWSPILKNCGRTWGERVARRLDRECQEVLGTRLGEMPLDRFLTFVTEYFVFHGWGRLEINTSLARESGVLEATLRGSVFPEILPDETEPVDAMIAGILASLFSYLSGTELDCMQTDCPTCGDDASRFIITAAARIKAADALSRSGLEHQQMLQQV